MKQDCPNSLTVQLPSRDATVQSEYPYRFKEVFLKYLEMRLPSLVFGVTPNAVRLLLQRLSARSAHSQHTYGDVAGQYKHSGMMYLRHR